MDYEVLVWGGIPQQSVLLQGGDAARAFVPEATVLSFMAQTKILRLVALDRGWIGVVTERARYAFRPYFWNDYCAEVEPA